MRISVGFKNDDIAIVSLSGKFLAGSDGPYLRQKVTDLMDAGMQKLMIDFEDVPYIDSTGLGFLAGARVTVQNAGGRMVLACLNQHVRKILNEVNMTQFFSVADNQEAAIALLNQPAPTPAPAPAAPAPAAASTAPATIGELARRAVKTKKKTGPTAEA